MIWKGTAVARPRTNSFSFVLGLPEAPAWPVSAVGSSSRLSGLKSSAGAVRFGEHVLHRGAVKCAHDESGHAVGEFVVQRAGHHRAQLREKFAVLPGQTGPPHGLRGKNPGTGACGRDGPLSAWRNICQPLHLSFAGRRLQRRRLQKRADFIQVFRHHHVHHFREQPILALEKYSAGSAQRPLRWLCPAWTRCITVARDAV